MFDLPMNHPLAEMTIIDLLFLPRKSRKFTERKKDKACPTDEGCHNSARFAAVRLGQKLAWIKFRQLR
jgi:hypothetical protein